MYITQKHNRQRELIRLQTGERREERVGKGDGEMATNKSNAQSDSLL